MLRSVSAICLVHSSCNLYSADSGIHTVFLERTAADSVVNPQTGCPVYNTRAISLWQQRLAGVQCLMPVLRQGSARDSRPNRQWHLVFVRWVGLWLNTTLWWEAASSRWYLAQGEDPKCWGSFRCGVVPSEGPATVRTGRCCQWSCKIYLCIFYQCSFRYDS